MKRHAGFGCAIETRMDTEELAGDRLIVSCTNRNMERSRMGFSLITSVRFAPVSTQIMLSQ